MHAAAGTGGRSSVLRRHRRSTACPARSRRLTRIGPPATPRSRPGLVQLQPWYEGAEYRAGWFGTFGLHPLGYTATVAVNPETEDFIIILTNDWDLGAWELESQILEAWASEAT